MIDTHIILLETRTELSASLCHMLAQSGFSVHSCQNVPELFRQAEKSCDIILLDIGQPLLDGFSLLPRLSEIARAGVVVLAEDAGLEVRLRALQSGADACLMQHGDQRELVAVILALIRRDRRRAVPVADRSEAVELAQVAPAGSWHLRDRGWTLVSPSGSTVSLSARERMVLQELLAEPGHPVDRLRLNELLYPGSEAQQRSRSVDVMISRLRRKASSYGLELPIRTVYGGGYLFVTE